MKTTTHCLLLLLLIASMQMNAQQPVYKNGFSVDPSVEEQYNLLHKKSKGAISDFAGVTMVNLDVQLFINDQPAKKEAALFTGKDVPLLVVPLWQGDSLVLSIGDMMFMHGLQLVFSKDSVHIENFVSSKSCECFKNNLSETKNHYGAGAVPTSYTLVVNQNQHLKKGDTLYGYVQTQGGNYYHEAGEGKYDLERTEYTGWFKIVL